MQALAFSSDAEELLSASNMCNPWYVAWQ